MDAESILAAIHELDKKLDVHLAFCRERSEHLSAECAYCRTVLDGTNGARGLKTRVDRLEGVWKWIMRGLITSGAVGGGAAGVLQLLR